MLCMVLMNQNIWYQDGEQGVGVVQVPFNYRA